MRKIKEIKTAMAGFPMAVFRVEDIPGEVVRAVVFRAEVSLGAVIQAADFQVAVFQVAGRAEISTTMGLVWLASCNSSIPTETDNSTPRKFVPWASGRSWSKP